MLAYKMVNTLDSMIGYKTERYRAFGCWAAHIDDIANYIPARLTALLMVLSEKFFAEQSGKAERRVKSEEFATALYRSSSEINAREKNSSLFTFVRKYGRCHASPNSGWPEAALAGILNCRFGGPHYYFGQLFDKPYIGHNDRTLTTADMEKAIRVNRMAETTMVVLIIITKTIILFL